ncbi:MAG: thioredoxin family protein [SAR202 cluster bacterium]|nr:thioredoxin family protein [SAR202 cluster bacterium]
MTLTTGKTAIPFTLPGVDGKKHSLADYGKQEAVVLAFTCNHCPYAQAWEGRLIQAQADYAKKGVQVLAISSNDPVAFPADDFDHMKQRAKEKGYNYPYLFDESQAVAKAYGAARTPEIFVFDKMGVLRYHGVVDDNHENPGAVQHLYLRDALDAVLAGRAPAVADTPPKGCTIKWKK